MTAGPYGALQVSVPTPIMIADLSGGRHVLTCQFASCQDTDTTGLSCLGARMTGLDFSSASIEQARSLVARTGDEVSFVESDVYDAVSALDGEQFDLVFKRLKRGSASPDWLL